MLTGARGSAAPSSVALFVSCTHDTLLPAAAWATFEVLERVGVRVDFPAEQTCCGQMHANTGYRADALALARRFVEVFGDAEAIVSPSDSCVA